MVKENNTQENFAWLAQGTDYPNTIAVLLASGREFSRLTGQILPKSMFSLADFLPTNLCHPYNIVDKNLYKDVAASDAFNRWLGTTIYFLYGFGSNKEYWEQPPSGMDPLPFDLTSPIPEFDRDYPLTNLVKKPAGGGEFGFVLKRVPYDEFFELKTWQLFRDRSQSSTLIGLGTCDGAKELGMALAADKPPQKVILTDAKSPEKIRAEVEKYFYHLVERANESTVAKILTNAAKVLPSVEYRQLDVTNLNALAAFIDEATAYGQPLLVSAISLFTLFEPNQQVEMLGTLAEALKSSNQKNALAMGMITPFNPWLTYGHTTSTKAVLAEASITSTLALYHPEAVVDFGWQKTITKNYTASWSERAIRDFGKQIGKNVEYVMTPYSVSHLMNNLGFTSQSFEIRQTGIPGPSTSLLGGYQQGLFLI